MLSIKNGKIAFKEKILLEDINLEIPESHLSIIIGPNGAGKTSLINILSGSSKLTGGEFINTYKKCILIPQKTHYPDGINLYEYVSSVFFQSGWKWSISKKEQDRVYEVLDKLNLSSKEKSELHQLSSGELQLANIAICLLSGADLILLDEPSANLDLINQVMILEILKKLTQKGITIVAIMHDITLAAKYGDKFIIVQKTENHPQTGKIVYGNKQEALTEYNLSKAYNYEFKVVDIDENTYIQSGT
ncbi:MAG: hypothetical protein A2287_02720 [Candidatus Melainabacteria bacterium RIFOXYA12_FULL_32_12]|nr:MAG: hypothetical protein A2287_02720 [Candidatus Melainabacteria bacterium RIFOXYA12_FULL_32_12]